ncbi:MFS transporter [Egibacter rhizosphaerae]|uniref:MFS transporter n=2 Tax=Egibacter rhizosphaerae TaxID=1670831 RepID=A0A411YLL4_9ACTN|nr:MFS transporter [Egibacter rhizosphaerae]
MPMLERLGLHRRELRAWAFYEWATTGVYAVIVTAVFPVYYETVAADGLSAATANQRFAITTTLAIVSVAVIAPVIGAYTDQVPRKKRFLAAFLAVGVVGTAGLTAVGTGDWLLALGLFLLVNVGLNGTSVFYDALLPHIARPGEVDRVSSGAFALGYLGAGLLLTVCLVVIEVPGRFGLPERTLPARVAFALVAAYWLAFSFPLFRRVPEPAPRIDPRDRPGDGPVVAAVRRLASTLRELRRFREAFLLLVAYLVYGDGIGTIIRLAGTYASGLGIDQATIIGAVIAVQFVGVPCAFLFGVLAGRIGTKRAILLGLVVYMGVAVFAFFMETALHFWALAIAVGTVQGGTQALSRSLFASMIPAHKSGEFFGLYGVMDRFAGMMGPALFAAVIAITGVARTGIVSVIVFFVVGGALLLLVDERRGRDVARAEERAAVRASSTGQA